MNKKIKKGKTKKKLTGNINGTEINNNDVINIAENNDNNVYFDDKNCIKINDNNYILGVDLCNEKLIIGNVK